MILKPDISFLFEDIFDSDKAFDCQTVNKIKIEGLKRICGDC
ncbi:MAG: hypothetical protein RBQ94_03840 [Methanimicrococcus sp.]|nr:hypothetical protein [Methanimicrococcus sp.]